jgi:site-specific DNA recombinase
MPKTGAAMDRYLTAFENGTLDPEHLAGRLAQLKARATELRCRRDELAGQVAAVPSAPPTATLRQVADHVADIVASGSHSQRKALIEVLIARIKITGPGRIVPVFRIPQPPATDQPQVPDGPATTHCRTAKDAVRAVTNLVGWLVELRGLGPLTPCLQIAVYVSPRGAGPEDHFCGAG